MGATVSRDEVATIMEMVGVGAEASGEGPPSVVINESQWSEFMARVMLRHNAHSLNFQVVSPSTPANYFHALRRQVGRPFSKPLVVLTPKSMLHHKPCRSPLADLAEGSRFQPVLVDFGCAQRRSEAQDGRHGSDEVAELLDSCAVSACLPVTASLDSSPSLPLAARTPS